MEEVRALEPKKEIMPYEECIKRLRAKPEDNDAMEDLLRHGDKMERNQIAKDLLADIDEERRPEYIHQLAANAINAEKKRNGDNQGIFLRTSALPGKLLNLEASQYFKPKDVERYYKSWKNFSKEFKLPDHMVQYYASVYQSMKNDTNYQAPGKVKVEERVAHNIAYNLIHLPMQERVNATGNVEKIIQAAKYAKQFQLGDDGAGTPKTYLPYLSALAKRAENMSQQLISSQPEVNPSAQSAVSPASQSRLTPAAQGFLARRIANDNNAIGEYSRLERSIAMTKTMIAEAGENKKTVNPIDAAMEEAKDESLNKNFTETIERKCDQIGSALNAERIDAPEAVKLYEQISKLVGFAQENGYLQDNGDALKTKISDGIEIAQTSQQGHGLI